MFPEGSDQARSAAHAARRKRSSSGATWRPSGEPSGPDTLHTCVQCRERSPARPAKQKIPNQPNLAEPFLHQHLTQHPATRHRLSPRKPRSAKFAKPVYQTNPILTAGDNAIGRATRQRPSPKKPNLAQIAENRNTKRTQSRLFTRFSALQINNTTPSPPPGTVTHIRRPTQSTTANRPSRRR